VPPDIVERETLCLSTAQAGKVVQARDVGFKEELLRLYSWSESNAAEKLVKLKYALRQADTESFWPTLTEGLADIADAQYVTPRPKRECEVFARCSLASVLGFALTF